MIRAAFLRTADTGYARVLRPLIFRSSAQTAHERMIRLLRLLDRPRGLASLLGALHRLASDDVPVTIGGVTLAAPLILAAGLVKGDGFAAEEDALAAVRAGRNIIPGWRSIPRLVGLVEFGSFTRWPRLGNPGVVVWRDVPARSTQNWVGLRNPGALAAAEFLAARRAALPPLFGINVAISPSVDDPDQQTGEVLSALAAFIERGVYPTWFTLNLSCPNTEDDPTGHQTAGQARQLCAAAVHYLQGAEAFREQPSLNFDERFSKQPDSVGAGLALPKLGNPRVAPTKMNGLSMWSVESHQGGKGTALWVKLGPNLSAEQTSGLMRVFAETGVRAVVATNTLPMPSPLDSSTMAGVSGGRLHEQALITAAALVYENTAHDYPVDVVGCGGVLDGDTYRDFANLGVRAVQYWSALVYRGPLAAALIAHEAKR